ncbi:hypothetical protein [Olivibacter sitiensis]|uniref:hypothetical protein n=1 Tax=Olivibacter sitiensis TaxID=376470 RepID=UPI0003F867FB|nr:hypothetical protein [Olivibacter sitiensis]
MNQKQKSLHAYTEKSLSKNIREDTSETGKLVSSLEGFNLDILSYRTGIKRDRLYRLTKLGIDKIETYELALIEMAADKESGELFKVLFKGSGVEKGKVMEIINRSNPSYP